MMELKSRLTRRRQHGVGLIEILVTIVLLSIGFLAAARMQVEGMRYSQSAYYQSQAYFLASDMINRMRTNSIAARDGEYDNIITAAGDQDQMCSANACSPAQIALQDKYEWGGYFYSRGAGANFIPALPSSDSISAHATVIPINDEIYQVRMLWSEIVKGEVVPQTLVVNFALQQSET